MTISTYSELQSALDNWLNQTNATARSAEFIALFEAKFAREVRVRAMMQRDTDATFSTEYTALPTSFLQMVTLKLTGSVIHSLKPVTNEWINEVFTDTTTGIPKYFTVLGSEVRVAPPPDGTYTAEMVYYKFAALSASNTTNWLLTSHPDLYLFGSLCEAEGFSDVTAPRIAGWKSRRDEEIASLIRAEKRAQWGGGVLRVRADVGA
jgi:hypothetical protein